MNILRTGLPERSVGTTPICNNAPHTAFAYASMLPFPRLSLGVRQPLE
ncbi:MAG: hypothetical protein P4L10_04185 [Acidobacteriaceae bacterium]|nr:hypothetical protein [Acidobacteriaceae bacterium]